MRGGSWVRSGVVLAAAVTALAAGYSSADAAFLRWAGTSVQTGSVRDCFGFAQDALRGTGFGSIRRSASEVTGSRPGVYVAITCVGTAPRVTAIIMVMSDNDGLAIQARDQVTAKIKGIRRID